MNIFRQLRWKLTLSYTLVTVSAFLVVTLILGGVLFSRVFIPVNIITPTGLVEVIMESITPLWSHIMAQSPVDQELIRLMWQEQSGEFITNKTLLQIGAVRLSVNTILSLRAMVIDSHGILVGRSDPSYLPTCKIGQPFCVERVPGLQAPLNAASAGETDPSQLYSVQENFMSLFGPTQRFTLAVPLLDQNSTQEKRVLGVLVVLVDAIPTQEEIPTHLLLLAGRSLVLFLLCAGLMGTIFGSISAHGLDARFKRLTAVTDLWSKGDFARFAEDTAGDEVSQFAQRLNNMAKQLQSLLRRQQEMAVSEERDRLARDLHDSAKQQALAASFELGTALSLFDRDPQQARQHLQAADELVDATRAELTNLVHQLRPLSFEGQDLSEILQEYVMAWSQRNDIVVNMDVEVDGELPLEIREATLRIVQEALANIARHSQAQQVDINLQRKPGALMLAIQDDGRGFNPAQETNGVGLRSMRERASALGGQFTLESSLGKGSKIVVTLPYET